MGFRVYVDESGTHSKEWLIIGMLFVPDHGALHSALCKAKDDLGYFNASPKRKARYKETHLTEFRSQRDVDVARVWFKLFAEHSCYFRCVVVDWSIWDGRYFGDPFEPAALKERRAYKKWAEMLLHEELKRPTGGTPIRNAELYLDRLRILYGYDVIDHLKDRFTANYTGSTPYIAKFQHTESWKDANQCLQLCDLLTGSVYQSLKPAKAQPKQAVASALTDTLRPLGLKRIDPGFWRQYRDASLSEHFPKFSEWFWQPTEKTKERRGFRKRRRIRK